MPPPTSPSHSTPSPPKPCHARPPPPWQTTKWRHQRWVPNLQATIIRAPFKKLMSRYLPGASKSRRHSKDNLTDPVSPVSLRMGPCRRVVVMFWKGELRAWDSLGDPTNFHLGSESAERKTQKSRVLRSFQSNHISRGWGGSGWRVVWQLRHTKLTYCLISL